MVDSDHGLDEEIDELVLSVKAVMLLCGNSVECRNSLRERIRDMQDEEIDSFLDVFHKPQRGLLPQISMAVGEIILASVLLFLGVAILTPALVGFSGPEAFLHYFVSAQVALINAVPYFPFVLLTDFIVAIALLSSAFYALKESAEKIESAGLRYR